MAATAATLYDGGPDASDAIGRASARPDFAILVYPVISMDPRLAHEGSRDRLLGGSADSTAIAARLSLETQARKDGPPVFLVASTDDRSVPVENALRFYEAVKGAGVPVELHVFESGRHGFGLATGDPILSTWTTIANGWLGRHGLLTRVGAAR
jgi:acetyl esterase/lipase